MKIRKIAADIVDDLNNFNNKTVTTDKYSQIEIVLKHLHFLELRQNIIKDYVNESISDFKEQFKDDPGNFLVAFAIEIYEEIKEMLEK